MKLNSKYRKDVHGLQRRGHRQSDPLSRNFHCQTEKVGETEEEGEGQETADSVTEHTVRAANKGKNQGPL